jgi:hypothetical protein
VSAVPDIDDFLAHLDLPEPPHGFIGLESAGITFAQDTAEVKDVGSQIVEFDAGVPATVRAAVADALLLAQLAADKAANGSSHVEAWYERYRATLKSLGWLESGMDFQRREAANDGADVHEAILPVLTAMLGPVAASAPLILSVLNGLKQMDKDAPWLTLFDRATAHSRGAKFQMGYARSQDGHIRVHLMATAVEAAREVTQILFFKFARESATLVTASTQLDIEVGRLLLHAPKIAALVEPHLANNIASIEI